MATKYQTSQQDEQGDFEDPSSDLSSKVVSGKDNLSHASKNQSATKSEATEVPEVKGIDGGSEDESSEAIMGMLGDKHTSMSSPLQRSGNESQSDESSESAEEESGTESEFENVEGWSAPTASESGNENDTLVEASFADPEAAAGGQEFFGAIAGLIAPMIPTLIKAVAPSVIRRGTKVAGRLVKKLNPTTQNVITRLKSLGISIPTNILSKLEASEEEFGSGESEELTDAELESLQKQLEALEVVIGPDDRVQIKNTRIIPWKRICHLKIQTKTGKFYLGTGFFIGPRTIITAGHCVYIHTQGGWAKNIVVSPGRNASETPFNTFTATKFRSVKGWIQNKERNYDYAAILLDKSAAVSPEIGAFGFGYYSNTFLMNKHLNTAGYPGDKPSGTMWFNGRKAKAITDLTIIYDIDTAGGQSGSALWFKGVDEKRIAVGIHTNGATSGNSATRITKPVFDNLKKWRTEGGNTL